MTDKDLMKAEAWMQDWLMEYLKQQKPVFQFSDKNLEVQKPRSFLEKPSQNNFGKIPEI